MCLSDERSLSDYYHISRSSIKRALGLFAQQGIALKKGGSGILINSPYLKNQVFFKYEESNLGITDSFSVFGRKQSTELLDYQVIKADEDLRQDLSLKESDFVYQIRRSWLLDGQPFLIEAGFIPTEITPELDPDILRGPLFNYLEDMQNKTVTRLFLTITVEPSISEDQSKPMLTPNEPVGVMEGIFFLDDRAPFGVSSIRIHHEYMKYNAFVNLS